MRKEFSAGTVIYRYENGVPYFLLLQYGRKKSSKTYWDFPKGHMEKSETKHETALREVKEETGLQVTIQPFFEHSLEYFFHDPVTHELVAKTVYFFLAQACSKEVTLSFEHIGFTWLCYKDALKKVTFHNAKELLKKAYEALRKEKEGKCN